MIVAKQVLKRLHEDAASHRMIYNMLASKKLFPPKLNVNKFAIGSVIEELFARQVSSYNIQCENVSAGSTEIDLVIEGCGYSIKSTQSVSDIILENYRGKQGEMKETCAPTFWVLLEPTQSRIIYFDNDTIGRCAYAGEIYKQSDSTLYLRAKFLKYMLTVMDPEHVVSYKVSELPPLEPLSLGSILADVVEQQALKRRV
jgi:hypothetical protein